jgi:HK97 family phage portal protein
VFELKANGDRDYRTDSTTYRLLNVRPNAEMTPFAFKEAALIQALVWGNFFAEIDRDMVGRPQALWPLMPERCCIERTEAGRLVVRVTNSERGDTPLDYDDVYHLHGPGIEGIAGFETVALGARTFAHAAAAERFGQAFYGNNAQLGTYLTTEMKLTQAQLDEVNALLNDKTVGPDKAFSVVTLPYGYKVNQAGIDQQKSQFIETRQHEIEEVCRWFGVPPHKVAHLLRSTNNNIEHQGIEFVRDALAPWAQRMSEEADWKLLPMRGRLRTEIDLEPLADGDAMTRAETDSKLVNGGILTPNEVRTRRGWNSSPDKNADKLQVQGAMKLLEKLGEEPEPVTAAPAAPIEEEEQEDAA